MIVETIKIFCRSQTDREKSLPFLHHQSRVVKRTALSKYENIKSNGLIAIKLQGNDQLVWLTKTSGDDHILLVSKEGKSIRFNESERPSHGP